MQRMISNDRGSSAVVVAIFMVVIVVVAAMAIDIGAMHNDKQQLQTGADAGALAVAQECARANCLNAGSTAQTMADANFNGDGASGAVASLDENIGAVRIETDAVRRHWFAPIIGIDSTQIHAAAGARWGYPTGGTAVLPLTFSLCALTAQAGFNVITDPVTGEVLDVDIPSSTTEQIIRTTKTANDNCTGPSGNQIPGGFGWLEPDHEHCKSLSAIGEWVDSDTGNDMPCSEVYFKKLVGKTVLLPVFDRVKGQGDSGQYQIFGYVAFTLSGYKLSGNVEYPTNNPPCSGNARCISGKFDRFADLSEDFEFSPNAPNFGAAVVALTE